MVASIIISSLTFILIILSFLIKPQVKIGKFSIGLYFIIAIVGATAIIIFCNLSLKEIFNVLTQNNAINPIKLLLIFFSLTILSVFLDEIGFFSYVASVVVKHANKSQIKLFTYLYLITSLLTIFTSNDIIILTFTPFIIYFSKNAKINPIPYLIGEFVAANTFSLTLLIGNPTNIYLATNFNIDFIFYLKMMIIPAILAGVTAYLLLLFIFKKQLKTPINVNVSENKINNKFLFITGLLHILLCIILIAISNYIHIEMHLICLFFVVSLISIYIFYHLFHKEQPNVLEKTVKRLPWELIPFIISMFIIVFALNKTGVTNKIYSLLGENNSILIYGATSFLGSNILNNIPMSVLFCEILEFVSTQNINFALFATIIGSNIGAYFTPLGALAGIMWMRILKHNGVNITFTKFAKFGAIIAIPVMATALLGLYFTFLIF